MSEDAGVDVVITTFYLCGPLGVGVCQLDRGHVIQSVVVSSISASERNHPNNRKILFQQIQGRNPPSSQHLP